MSWIDTQSRAVREEILARIDTDPQAVQALDGRPRRWATTVLVICAFCGGIVVGWLAWG